MDRPYHDADWLDQKYHQEGQTQREIAEECGVSPRAIRTWMNKHGIETREVAGENHGRYGEERSPEVKSESRRRYRAASSRKIPDKEWLNLILEANFLRMSGNVSQSH